MMRVKMPCRLRARASTSVVRSAWSGTSSTRASRKGSVRVYGPRRTRRMPWISTRTVPSGTRTMRCTTAAVPISCRCSGGGSASSGSRLTTSASTRSGRFMTSSIRRIERGSPMASGATASGKTTVSFRGRTGSVSGRASISSGATGSSTTSACGASVASVLTRRSPRR